MLIDESSPSLHPPHYSKQSDIGPPPPPSLGSIYPETRGIVRVRSLVNETCGSFTVSPPLSKSPRNSELWSDTQRGAVFQKRERMLYPLEPWAISHRQYVGTWE